MLEYEFIEPTYYWTLLVFIPLLCFLTLVELFLIKISIVDFRAIFIALVFGIYLLFVCRTFCWTLFGREQIKITANSLLIFKSGTFLVRPQEYSYTKMKNIRIENTTFNFLDFCVSRTSLTSLKSRGCITFNYQNRTINFGGTIDDVKAEKIAAIIKAKTGTLE